MTKKLKADPRNARIHSERNKEAVKKSLQELGAGRSIVVDADGFVIGGNAVYEQAQELGIPVKEIETKGDELIVVRRVDLKTDDPRRKALALADNQIAMLAEWDDVVLEEIQGELLGEIDFETMGFDEPVEPIDDDEGAAALVDQAEELNEKWKVARGQIWEIPGKAGVHRVMCGDSTDAGDVALLMERTTATLCHADPPYGMGKESEGVANDNLYREKLDAFQMQWWAAWRPHLADNGSVYIWGNAEDLWRLWYRGGLKDSGRLTFRNEIVWDKGSGGYGVRTEAARCYFPTERCIFFMLGEQGFNNNLDNYWEGWEPLRAYLNREMEKCGGRKAWRKALGNQMGTHYFSKSQWAFPTEEAYKKLQSYAKGDAFKRDYDELKRDYDELKRDYDELKREFYATRAYFDNTHDCMTDVWKFAKVIGEDRYGHATPKPVEMIARIVKSSSRPNDYIVEPFLGTGSTAVAAEQEGRVCYGMEIEPKYVAVTLERFSSLGLKPKRVEPESLDIL